jgi:iron complex outermembrane receptor protein
VLLDDRRRSRRTGVFVQDEYALNGSAVLHTGLRIDKPGSVQTLASPRLGLVLRPGGTSTLKLLYGSAFRAPNAYELYYAFPGSNAPNPSLRPERMEKYEVVFENYLRPDTRATAGLYHYRIRNLINAITDPDSEITTFQNIDRVRANGLELELERAWSAGAHVRSSLALQTNRDAAGNRLNNSPRALWKLNAVSPYLVGRLRAGFELQAMSSRTSLAGHLSGQALANLNLVWDNPRRGTEISLGIFNLADRRVADPVQFDPATPDRDSIQQDGRAIRFKLVQHF